MRTQGREYKFLMGPDGSSETIMQRDSKMPHFFLRGSYLYAASLWRLLSTLSGLGMEAKSQFQSAVLALKVWFRLEHWVYL